ncbi:hypothetical protein SAMN05660297_02394 [Natronincola peptidivorans]|uniref:CAAX prenyl protease 2/Lysostaphin resistance protein A-like domain-containing protein n=1 Tax=Natronincola peptidivorans TaxID=426128 RepID=A0A1I0ECL5_9FIRM|nr:type II CAAX endopeptidase family protein [Natronincola peptidivorans]SET42986.1 hypothetical protein SAMN05660297_02394 [Natronincola peptidivorans]
MDKIFINNDKQLRSGWKILTVFAICMFINLAFNSILSIKLNHKSLFNDEGIIQIFRSPSLFFIIVAIFAVKKIEKWELSAIGFKNPKNQLRQLLMGSILGSCCFIAIIIVLWLLNGVAITNSLMEPSFSSVNIYAILIFSIFPGIGEEVLFRGYFLKLLSNSVGTTFAIGLTSIFFSIVHGANDGYSIIAFVNLFLFSLFLSFTTIITKNIWTAVCFHIAWNFFQGSVFSMSISGSNASGIYLVEVIGKDWITGGSFGVEGGLIVTAILCLLVIGTFIKYNSRLSIKQSVSELRT